MDRVHISVINDLVSDQRVNRMANLLTGLGFEVVCIGRRLKSTPATDTKQYGIRRFRMLFNRGPLFYACFNIRLFFTLLLSKRPSLFISNDLDTLPANYLVSRIRKVKLIYDSHELFTQVPELINRKRVQKAWKRIEYIFVTRVNHAVTVSYPIATIYRRLYGTRFKVVRNFPVARERPDPAPQNSSCPGKGMIIYQGALNVGRGLELVIEAMQYLKDDACFVLAGTGDIENRLRRQVRDLGLTDRVFFKGRLTPDELYPLTCSADLGISLEEDLGLNYRYSLPNKLFDYIQCRVPVLCSDLPEMSKIVATYGIGVIVRDRDPERVAKTIRYMIKERDSGAWRDALDRAARELCWENESGKFLELLYDCGTLKNQKE